MHKVQLSHRWPAAVCRPPKKKLCSYTPNAIGIKELAGHDGHPLVDA